MRRKMIKTSITVCVVAMFTACGGTYNADNWDRESRDGDIRWTYNGLTEGHHDSRLQYTYTISKLKSFDKYDLIKPIPGSKTEIGSEGYAKLEKIDNGEIVLVYVPSKHEMETWNLENLCVIADSDPEHNHLESFNRIKVSSNLIDPQVTAIYETKNQRIDGNPNYSIQDYYDREDHKRILYVFKDSEYWGGPYVDFKDYMVYTKVGGKSGWYRWDRVK